MGESVWLSRMLNGTLASLSLSVLLVSGASLAVWTGDFSVYVFIYTLVHRASVYASILCAFLYAKCFFYSPLAKNALHSPSIFEWLLRRIEWGAIAVTLDQLAVNEATASPLSLSLSSVLYIQMTVEVDGMEFNVCLTCQHAVNEATASPLSLAYFYIWILVEVDGVAIDSYSIVPSLSIPLHMQLLWVLRDLK